MGQHASPGAKAELTYLFYQLALPAKSLTIEGGKVKPATAVLCFFSLLPTSSHHHHHPEVKRFSTVVFPHSSLPQADILLFTSCFSIKLAGGKDYLLETCISPPPPHTIFIPETNLRLCNAKAYNAVHMCCPKSESDEGDFCTETASLK